MSMKSLVVGLLVLGVLYAAASAEELDNAPSWILPLAPAGYGGPGVINPYSNVNPYNPMAAQMEAGAAGKKEATSPQSQMGAATEVSCWIRML